MTNEETPNEEIEEVIEEAIEETKTAEAEEDAEEVEVTGYVFVHEGQDIDLPLEVGADDLKVRRLLSTFLPLAATADIERTEPDSHGTVVITLAQKARPKGIQIATVPHIHQALIDLPEGKNPAIELYDVMAGQKATTPIEMHVFTAAINKALDEGQFAEKAMKSIAARLQKAAPMEAPVQVAGWS